MVLFFGYLKDPLNIQVEEQKKLQKRFHVTKSQLYTLSNN